MVNNDQNNNFENSQSENVLSVSGVENVTKKGKGKKAALIGGISAAVVVGGCAAAYGLSDTVKNQVKLRLSSPEKYYAWVTEKNSEDLGKLVSEGYKKSLENYDKGTETQLSVYYEMSETVKGLLDESLEEYGVAEESEGFADFVRNTDRVAISGDMKSNKAKSGSNVGIDLGDSRILSLDVVTDMEDMSYFFRIPELSEKWIGMDLGSVLEENLYSYGASAVMETYKEIMDDPASFLSPEDLEKEINRYAGVWASYANDVTLEKKEKVDICDITVNYTVASVELTEKDMDKLGLEFAKALKDDEVIRNIVVKELELVDSDSYKMMLSQMVDSLKEDIKDRDYDDDESVVVDTYIDGTGTIRGFCINTDDEKFIAALGKDGDSIRGEIKATDNDGNVYCQVMLSAEENGKKYSGDITFKVDEEEYFVIGFNDFEVVNEDKGYMNGDVSIEIADIDPIDISLKSDGKKQDVSFGLKIDGTDYGRIGFTYSFDYGAKVAVPDKSDAFMLDVNEDVEITDYVTEDEIIEFAKRFLISVGFSEDEADEFASSSADSILDGIGDIDLGLNDDDLFDYDYDDDDVWIHDDLDDDYLDDDDLDDDFTFDFDFDDLEYADYEDYMTEDEFKEFKEELQEYYKEYNKSGVKDNA